MSKVKNAYRSGRIQEGKVASELKRRGWKNLRKSKGSRGPADLYGRTPSGNKAYIQVKSGSASVSSLELRRLQSLVKKRGGLAITATRNDGTTKLRFWGNWRRRHKR
jgi:hypothetical protein